MTAKRRWWPSFPPLAGPNKLMLLTTLGLIGIFGTTLISNLATKQEAKANDLATGNDWVDASFPVENFAAYTSPFGPRGGDFHYGLDLAAPMGSYIRSWWSGVVVEIIDDNRCGTGIIVQSGEWEHIYCHIQGSAEKSGGVSYLVDRNGGIILGEGQVVPAGARIARVGMTGRTSGPHLHWGLKYDGSWVDPALVLQQMYDRQEEKV